MDSHCRIVNSVSRNLLSFISLRRLGRLRPSQSTDLTRLAFISHPERHNILVCKKICAIRNSCEAKSVVPLKSDNNTF